MNFSRWSKIALLVAMGSCALRSSPARAQNGFFVPAPNVPQVPEVGDNDLPTLSLAGLGAISLRASLAGLRANPGADANIKAWVARGNVVFLHTDAAQSFGFGTVPLRATVAAQGGQEFVRTRAALPFGAHPLLRGDASPNMASLPFNTPTDDFGDGPPPSPDVTRLPGVARVFGSLRDGDVLVVASDVATPLLQVDDITGNGNEPPEYAAAITSLGAGWAIFCPDDIDLRRADGALFARGLQDFVPGTAGQPWIGIPTRVLAAGTLATLADAVAVRLSASNASNSTAALPAFGTNAAPVVAPPVSEPTLPIEREEATALLAILRNGGVRTTARVALLQARLALQNGDANACAASLEIAAADPALSASVDFWNACLNAQLGNDTSLPAPQRASLLDDAARTFARSALLGSSPAAAAGMQTGVASTVSPVTARLWSQRLARLTAISSLSPPLSDAVVAGDASATIRFFPGDANAPALEGPVVTLLNDDQFGWHAPHVEVILLPTPQDFFALRRALGRTDTNFVPDGEQIGNTILLVSGGANDATLKRLWSRVLLSTWSDDARPLPAWLSIGIQGVALGGNSPQEDAELRRAARGGALSLFDASIGVGTSPLGRARSTALVEWLYSRFGVGAGSEMVGRMAAGGTPADALSAATGKSLEELDGDWGRFLGA